MIELVAGAIVYLTPVNYRNFQSKVVVDPFKKDTVSISPQQITQIFGGLKPVCEEGSSEAQTECVWSEGMRQLRVKFYNGKYQVYESSGF